MIIQFSPLQWRLRLETILTMQNSKRTCHLAVKQGLLTEKELDNAVRNVLRVGFRLGAFDPPEMSPYSKLGMDDVRSQNHLDLSEKVAEESITLLNNTREVLPLSRDQIHSVAVIGPAGGDEYETGNYYGKPERKVSITGGDSGTVRKRHSCRIRKGTGFSEAADKEEMNKAVQLARKSDVVILCLGTNLSVEAGGP